MLGKEDAGRADETICFPPSPNPFPNLCPFPPLLPTALCPPPTLMYTKAIGASLLATYGSGPSDGSMELLTFSPFQQQFSCILLQIAFETRLSLKNTLLCSTTCQAALQQNKIKHFISWNWFCGCFDPGL